MGHSVGERRMRTTPNRAGGGQGELGQGTGESEGSVVAVLNERCILGVREGVSCICKSEFSGEVWDGRK